MSYIVISNLTTSFEHAILQLTLKRFIFLTNLREARVVSAVG